jgi:hypothetical protein
LKSFVLRLYFLKKHVLDKNMFYTHLLVVVILIGGAHGSIKLKLRIKTQIGMSG